MLVQLWLACRLSGVEHHVDQAGLVPLIVDDVLVNFDDARAGSAFCALASLAKRTQVLVLTHHPHLVDRARARRRGSRRGRVPRAAGRRCAWYGHGWRRLSRHVWVRRLCLGEAMKPG